MKALVLTLCMIAFTPAADAQYPPLQGTPSTAPRPREIEHRLPADEPEQVQAPAQRRTIDAAQVKCKAEELAKLAESIPVKTQLAGKGVVPKDLNQQLKRIEKLSKQLRRELFQ